MGQNSFTIETGLFLNKDVRVTHSNSNQSRSESDIAINPLNPDNIIGASKKFYDPAKYRFYLGVYYSFDAGEHWQESTLPIQPNWQGMTDPSITFDPTGVAFLLTEPIIYQDESQTAEMIGQGLYLYISKDGGKTWGTPTPISNNIHDDKQWITSDQKAGSPFYGRIYCAWGVSDACGFSYSLNGGKSWSGAGGATGYSHIENFSAYAPSIITDSAGWVHIFNMQPYSDVIYYVCSKDGGFSFEPSKKIVIGIKGFGSFPKVDGWSTFPNGKFRISSMVTSACANGQTLIVAWPDTRENNLTRIYYRISYDGGETWQGNISGTPLISDGSIFGDSHCFMPQLAATETGKIGCAFYIFGKERINHQQVKYRINVYLAASFNNGSDFPYRIKITDSGWDPNVNAPFAHGNPNLYFIGDYFGLDAASNNGDFFTVLWTDTTSGVQEICYSQIDTLRITSHLPFNVPLNVVHRKGTITIIKDDIVIGGLDDGPIYILGKGGVIPVGPATPFAKIIESIGLFENANFLSKDLKIKTEELALRELKKAISNVRNIPLG